MAVGDGNVLLGRWIILNCILNKVKSKQDESMKIFKKRILIDRGTYLLLSPNDLFHDDGVGNDRFVCHGKL